MKYWLGIKGIIGALFITFATRAVCSETLLPVNADCLGQGWSFMEGLSVFVLACFVGYYVVWRVTPALHSPLMAVTNAISSVIVVGAVLAAGVEHTSIAKIIGFLAVVLASVNIFGGFVVTGRMLSMFAQKKK